MPELSSAMPLDPRALHEARKVYDESLNGNYHKAADRIIRAYLSSLTPSPVGELHPVSMSMFATKDDMLRHLLAERKQTAASLTSLSAEVARKDAEIERLRAHRDILAAAMCEVKATTDGRSDQPITAIVSGCLDEILALSAPKGGEHE